MKKLVSDFSLFAGLVVLIFWTVVYRLTASLAFFLRLSPHYESQIRPLLDVLQIQQILKDKLVKGLGWNTDSGIAKKNVRKLVEEVADKLCA